MKLNNDIEMPEIGIGTYLLEPKEAYKSGNLIEIIVQYGEEYNINVPCIYVTKNVMKSLSQDIVFNTLSISHFDCKNKRYFLFFIGYFIFRI